MVLCGTDYLIVKPAWQAVEREGKGQNDPSLTLTRFARWFFFPFPPLTRMPRRLFIVGNKQLILLLFNEKHRVKTAILSVQKFNLTLRIHVSDGEDDA